MGKDGILSAQDITARSRRSLSGYVASVGSLTDALQALLHTLEKEDETGAVPIMSQEGWGSNDDITDLKVFAAELTHEIELHIVGYVRPQISWLQSAWWQWYAWRGDGLILDDAWKWLRHTVKWQSRLQRFSGIPCVATVSARLQNAHADITRDFLEYLEIDKGAYAAGKRINMSVSATHVALYRRFPRLRTPHDSRADLLIDKLLPTHRPPPFILTRDFAQQVVEEVHEDNHALLNGLDEIAQAKMQADQRWWSVEPYAEHWGGTRG